MSQGNVHCRCSPIHQGRYHALLRWTVKASHLRELTATGRRVMSESKDNEKSIKGRSAMYL